MPASKPLSEESATTVMIDFGAFNRGKLANGAESDNINADVVAAKLAVRCSEKLYQLPNGSSTEFSTKLASSPYGMCASSY